MTPEQAALLRKAEASLQAAHVLARQGFPEFAVSRAYYAMLYAAEALLLGDGLAYSKHSAVIAALGQRFAKTGRLSPELHRHLIEAEALRNVCDYDPLAALPPAVAQQQIERAAAFLVAAIELMAPSEA